MNCNDAILACLPSGCSCVKYDPVTGQLAIDGNLVKLYIQSASVVTAETLGGTVLNPAIEVGASAITGLCAAIGPCMAALPPGSIDVSALQPGAEGTVLQSLGGVATWAGLDDKAIQKAFGDNPIPLPPIDPTELARVYGEDANKNLTSVTPQGVYESGAATMPLIGPGIPLKQITGLDAGGSAVKASIIQNGAETVGVGQMTALTLGYNENALLAEVVAPADGLYTVVINAATRRTLVSPIVITSGSAYADISSAYLVIGATTGLVYHSGSDYPIICTPITTYPAGSPVGEAVRVQSVNTLWLKAGEKLELRVFNTGRGGTGDIVFTPNEPPYIKLVAHGPMAIAP